MDSACQRRTIFCFQRQASGLVGVQDRPTGPSCTRHSACAQCRSNRRRVAKSQKRIWAQLHPTPTIRRSSPEAVSINCTGGGPNHLDCPATRFQSVLQSTRKAMKHQRPRRQHRQHRRRQRPRRRTGGWHSSRRPRPTGREVKEFAVIVVVSANCTPIARAAAIVTRAGRSGKRGDAEIELQRWRYFFFSLRRRC